MGGGLGATSLGTKGKMKKLISIILKSSFIFSFIFIISCDKKESVIEPPPQSPTYIVPLTLNNQWTFIRTEYDTLGLITKIDTIDYKIVNDTLIGGQHCFKEDYWSFYYRNDSQGLWRWNPYPKLIYKYPAKVGDTFFNDYLWEIKVISIDTLINTPMGKLSCYQYQLDFYGFKTNDFLAPGFGFVIMEGAARSYPRLTQPFLFERWEMISANINN